MRAKRMMALLCDGWIKGSGSSSAKAGMNGGMDYLCGRLVYYDGLARCHQNPTLEYTTTPLTRLYVRRDHKRLWFQRLGAHRVLEKYHNGAGTSTFKPSNPHLATITLTLYLLVRST